jgi:hypothetical protein
MGVRYVGYLLVLAAMAIRLPIGIVAPVQPPAASEEVTVTLMPIAMQVFTVVVIIACSITHMEIAHGDHQLIVALIMRNMKSPLLSFLMMVVRLSPTSAKTTSTTCSPQTR